MAYQQACNLAEISRDDGRALTLKDEAGSEVEIALVLDEQNRVHAISRYCTHGDVPLEEGDVIGCAIECWAHGASFDLETGAPTLPATKPIKIYACQVRDGAVWVDVENVTN